jgi:hypothetical protein
LAVSKECRMRSIIWLIGAIVIVIVILRLAGIA